MSDATEGGLPSRIYGWLTTTLSPVIALGWIVAAIAAWVLLPPLGGSSSAPLGDIVPADGASLGAQERALKRFGSTFGTDTIVVQRNPRGLSTAELASNARGAITAAKKQLPGEMKGIIAAVPLVNAPIPGVPWRETGTTALTYLFLSPDLNLVERDRVAHLYADAVLLSGQGTTTGVTGAAPARLQQFREIDENLPWVEVATVLAILVIVAGYFRSIGAPLVTLLTAAVAYVIAVRSLAWIGERAGVTVPSEIEPVLVVLLLGLVTDYTVFFMSETRRRLRRGEPRMLAARRATARIAPIVFTAGVLVAGGAASLIAGRMDFFRVFGPGLAAAALAVTLVCVTFVPALLALFGPRMFGRGVSEQHLDERERIETGPPSRLDGERRERMRLRAAGLLGALRASRTQAAREGGHVASLMGARLVATRPAALVLLLVTVAVLAFAASGARTVDLTVSHVPSLPKGSEPRRAADAAARAFGPGVLAPTEVVVTAGGIVREREALERLQGALGDRPGVASVVGPVHARIEELGPLLLSRDGAAARYAVFLDSEPTGADAIDAIGALRAAMPAMVKAAGLPDGTRFDLIGESALAEETVDSIVADLGRIGFATSFVTFVLLALFLRGLIAPLLLLVGSVLAFAASFGLVALLLPSLMGSTDVVYYVPLVGAVLLIGLGSDYNVFIAGRIREEAGRRRLSEAIAVAAPSASRAITVAGLTLAATFALLALVPLRPFRELALLMSVGVLVDALLVRPLLIPAMLSVAGRLAWWPGNPRRSWPERDFLQEVARRSGEGLEDARRITAATLTTLAERIPVREARELAAHLPAGLRGPLEDADCERGAFGAAEFVARVAGRAGESVMAAYDDAAAVIATLVGRLPETELDYVRAALSEDYRPLFGDADPRREPSAEPVGAG